MESLLHWQSITARAAWRHFADVRAGLPHADAADAFTVFNITGNKCRLQRAEWRRRIRGRPLHGFLGPAVLFDRLLIPLQVLQPGLEANGCKALSGRRTCRRP
ncbi:MAG: type II toxin-antitoxin system HigB family toxin [Bryobacteraceae bacterium]